MAVNFSLFTGKGIYENEFTREGAERTARRGEKELFPPIYRSTRGMYPEGSYTTLNRRGEKEKRIGRGRKNGG